MFYIVPHKRYMYTTPKGRRQIKSAKYTAPFPSFWYCHVPSDMNGLIDKLYRKQEKHDKTPHGREREGNEKERERERLWLSGS
mmetsp:Transcript_22794/g.23016  ORF Transcript_22794/g.23016 Transcript_22794/m.23016 type:complete len:83 (+) Transcript_22794:83-331(+)